MASVGALSQKLQFLISANADEAIKVFQKTGTTAEKELGKAESKIDKVGAGLTKFGAGAMAFSGVAAAALYKLGTNYMDLGVEIGKFSDATGVASEMSSRFIEIAGDVGVSTESLQGAFIRMEKAIASSPEKFDELGVSIAYAADGSVDAGETFIRTADAIGKIEDPTKRAQVASEIFGRGFAGIAELIQMGATDMRAALDSVSEGKIFDAQETVKAREMRASMDELTDSFQEIGLTIGKSVLPVMQSVAGVVTGITSAFDSLPGPIKSAAGGILGVGTVALGAAGALSFVAGQVIKFRDNLGGLDISLRNAEGSFTKLGATIGVAGVALAGLAIYQAQAAQEQRDLNDAISELSKVSDDAMAGSLAAALAEGVLAGQDFKQTLIEIGDESYGTLLRIKELADAGRLQGNQFVDSERFTRALNDALAESSDRQQQAAIDAKKSANAHAEFDAEAENVVGTSDDLAIATEDVSTAMQSAASAGDRYRESISRLYDEVTSQTQAQLGYESATINLNQAYDDFIGSLLEAQKDGKVTREELLGLQESMVGLKGDVISAAEAFAEQSGAVDGSKQSIQLQIEELQRQKQLFPELAGFIDQYIRTLERIPTQVNTSVTVNGGGFFDGGVYDSGTGRSAANGMGRSASGGKPAVMSANSLWQKALSAWGASGKDSTKSQEDKLRERFYRRLERGKRKYEVGDWGHLDYFEFLKRLTKEFGLGKDKNYLSDEYMAVWREMDRVIANAASDAEAEAAASGTAGRSSSAGGSTGNSSSVAGGSSNPMSGGSRSPVINIHLKGLFVGTEAEMRKAVRPLVPAISRELDRYEKG